MLVRVNGALLNVDQVRLIEELPRSDAGLDRLMVTWADGTKQQFRGRMEAFEGTCGQCVPAPAGFQVLSAYEIEGEVQFATPAPVVAFRIDGQDSPGMTPICPDGPAAPVSNEVMAVLYPDGQCFNPVTEEWHATQDEWQARARARLLHQVEKRTQAKLARERAA